MKAVVYKEPFKVAVEDVPRAKIQNPNDAIVKITTTAICGSDLHMYEGRTAAKPGIVFGHENLGIVEEIGSGVTNIKVGDRVVMPFNIGCGHCRNCEEQYTGFCTNVNPGFAGGAYGYVGMGPYMGGQAEYLRVPYADFNALKLPNNDNSNEQDFVLLADIFPTGWGGVAQSGFKPGETIAIFGGGPVGLMAAYSAKLQGASKIFSVDGNKERLDKAKSIGAIPINRHECDPVEEIINQTDGEGVDRGVDAVGYQASSTGGKNVPNVVLVSLVNVVRPTGGIGSPGLYVTQDPGAPDESAKQGMMQFPIGKFFEKGLKMSTGQCNVKRYNRYLRDLIISGVAKPSFVVSHEIKIDEAPIAYEKFDKRVEGYIKVMIHPQW
ncbi:MAG TPA: glutathione-independent formaldehyde dehydrogenase [Nitrososphaeraceae archaeon]